MIEAFAFQEDDMWVVDVPALNSITQAFTREEVPHMLFDLYESLTEQKADPANFSIKMLEGKEAQDYVRQLENETKEVDAFLEALARKEQHIA